MEKKNVTPQVVERVNFLLNEFKRISAEDARGRYAELEKIDKELYEIGVEYNLHDRVFEENGKKGVVDINGHVLVPALYDGIVETYDYACYDRLPTPRPVPVRNGDGKCALAKCDGTGALVCAFEYDVIGDLYGSPEYYICTKVVGEGEQFYGVIDSEGNELVPCEMEYIDIMINSYSLLYKGELVGALSFGGKYIEPLFCELENSDPEYLRGRKGDEWGYVGDDGSFEADEEAEPVEESMPDEVRESMFKNDDMKKVATLDVVKRVDYIAEKLARIHDGEERATRKEIDALYKEYDAIREAYDLFDQLFEKDGKVGLCNVAGKVLVPAMYKDFSETYVYRRYGYVMPVPACNFIDKYALVKCDGKGTPLCGFEYEMIKFMFGSCALYRCWKKVGNKLLAGVMDCDGNMLVPCEMDVIYAVSNNIAVIEKDGKFGGITMDNFYLEPVYDEVEDKDGYLYVCKEGIWGYISRKGEFIDENDEDRMDEEELVLLLEF